jgi:hypothetical protein
VIALNEPFVAAVAEFEIAQVRGDAARDRVEAVAAGAVLAIGRLADLDCLGIAAIGVVREPGVVVRLDVGQRAGVHRLGRDIAVGQQLGADAHRCSDHRTGQDQAPDNLRRNLGRKLAAHFRILQSGAA